MNNTGNTKRKMTTRSISNEITKKKRVEKEGEREIVLIQPCKRKKNNGKNAFKSVRKKKSTWKS